MKAGRRLSPRSIRFVSLFASSALLFTTLIEGTPRRSTQQGRERRLAATPPESGPPAAVLPNLNELKQRRQVEPTAATPIESTMRSRRKPLESRHGLRVGDPLPRPTPLPTVTPGPTVMPSPLPSPSLRATGFASTQATAQIGKRLSIESIFIHSNLRLLNHQGLRFLNDGFLHSNRGASTDPLYTVSFDVFTPPVPQSGSSKIVFASNRDGSMQIYVMNADGSSQYRVTNSGANDDYPRWSPDGTKILFESDRDNTSTGYMDIYVMNADGSGVIRLTTDPNDDSMPMWSSDGSHIVFQSMRNGTSYQVYSMNANGSNQINLTNNTFSDGEPSYSPDGSKVAFATDRDHPGYDSVYVMNSTGLNQHRVTFSADNVSDMEPVWSRDGSKIAFVSTRDSTTETWQETDDDGNVLTKSRVHLNKEIYLMNADGSGQARLTNNAANDDLPSWSPDGSKIVFRSDRDRDCCDPSAQVWTMNPDGSGLNDVSNNQVGDYTASWVSDSGNQPPIANPGGSYSGIVSQNVPFNGSGSFDPDGTIASYSWTFGDAGTGSGAAPTHAYSAAGTYTVTLTVTDNLGAQGTTTTSVTISSSSSDGFANNFLIWGLGRSPHGDESQYWTDIMRSAYPQGQPSMLMAMQEFGMTVFESAEYVGRNRSDHDYVYDLYKTYLMRDPDADGWNFWTTQCGLWGRESVREAFDDCTEFQSIVANLTASGSPSSAVASRATAEVDLFNQPGDQVQARDCEWNATLLSLPGRAGLDLGLGLSYSSQIWTRSGPYIYFNYDEDDASPSMGFHLGFPTIQWRSFDAQVGRNVYELITSSGRRVELRQIGTSNLYESADSSHLQLDEGSTTLILLMPDGTQMSFEKQLNGWCVNQIEDRNGNLISVQNDWRGDIQKVTDTLGREINFLYDTNANISSITWNGATQPWVTFGWGTVNMQPTFGLEVVGTHSNENIPVLNFVKFDDGSYTKFDFNGYGQAKTIAHYASDSSPASDNHQLNSTVYNYDTTGDDCPRIYESRVTAENWTGINGVPSVVVTQFNTNGDGSHQMIAPDQATVYKEFYGTNWQHGLVTSTQVLTGSTPQKTTTTSYTQDNTGVNYQTNPRVTATDITDGTNQNHRHTTIGYQTFTLPTTNVSCSLPNEVYEYDSDQSTVLRRTHTHYKTDAAYLYNHNNINNSVLVNRIIGLKDETDVYEGTTTMRSKTTYIYDWNDANGDYLQATAGTPTQHDSRYSTDSSPVRGNLVKVQRWDVSDPNQTTKTEDKIGYDTDGSVIFTLDALDHRNSIYYSDKFSADGTVLDAPRSFSTFAYPTEIKDADNFSSYIWYRYDFGAKTRAQGPPPDNQPNGIIQTFLYDNASRLQRVTTANTGAYTHYVYGPNSIQTFGSVNTVAANYLQSDSYKFEGLDGLGRTIAVATNHPGSIGQYSAVITTYDQMGRAVSQSNPTETSTSGSPWPATGDDDPNNGGYGWKYTNQSYDWKGRPRVTTHPDGTHKDMSYQGCGCAGGEIVTLTDEGTVVNDENVHRNENIYSDALGRQWKTEVLNFDGSVYSTAVSVFNARNQVKFVNQYAGPSPGDASSTNEAVSCVSGNCQQTTMSYDGYARLQTKHVPEQQDQSGNPTHASYSYFDDDTVNTVTDGRGAIATYGYNGRHQVRTVSHVLGGYSTINIGYDYDAAGNRVSMSHSIGGVPKDSVSYAYDSLSRMTSETRHINALGGYGPNGNGDYSIGYGYTISGELQTITDPFNSTTTLHYDTAGRRLNSPGSADGISYRAWGAVKSEQVGGLSETVAYNSRLQPTEYRRTFNGNNVYRYDYSYYDDGRLKQLTDLDDVTGQPQLVTFHYMSRVYGYDQAGRVASVSALPPHPYSIPAPFTGNYGYDAFNNMNSRSGQYALNPNQSDGASYASNRRVQTGWSYDADGRLSTSADTSDSGGSSAQTWSYDAAGNEVTVSEVLNSQTTTNTMAYDGDRQLISESVSNGASDYLVRSAVLGTVLIGLDATGNRSTTYISPWFRHPDPSGLQENGQARDPFGNVVSNVQPPVNGPPPYVPFYGATWGGASWSSFVNANNFSTGCYAASNNPADCNTLSKQGMTPDFWANLPGVYGDMDAGLARYEEMVYKPYGATHTSGHEAPGSASQLGQNGHSDGQEKATGGLDVTEDGELGDTTGSGGYGDDSSNVDYANNVVTIHGGAQLVAAFFMLQNPQKPLPVPGPDPTRPPRGGMDDNQWTNFNRGYNVALNRLADPTCLAAVSQLAGVLDRDGPQGAVTVLKTLYASNRFVYSNDIGAAIAQTSIRGGGTVAMIRLSDKFFAGEAGMSNRNTDALYYGEVSALTILHELAHALGAGHLDPKVDGGKSERPYTDAIYDGCFANHPH